MPDSARTTIRVVTSIEQIGQRIEVEYATLTLPLGTVVDNNESKSISTAQPEQAMVH